MRFVYVVLALVLSGAVARADVLIYRLGSTERTIGGGKEARMALRGYVILDLDTFDLSLVRAGKINGQKEVAQDYIRGADIQTVSGAGGRTQTVISVLDGVEQADGLTFDMKSARGTDALITYGPGLTAQWPKKFSIVGRSLAKTNGVLEVNESTASLTYLERDTVNANTLDESLEQATAVALNYYLEKGYGGVPPYDILEDMEAGSAGELVTPAVLASMTRAGGAFGSWQLINKNASVSSSPLMKVSTAQKARGTRSIGFDAADNGTYAEFTLTESKARCSAGFAFKLDSLWTGVSYGSYDIFRLAAENGEYLICNYDDTLGAQVVAVHTSAPAGLGAAIPISNNTWYWCSMLWDSPNNTATLKLYDYTTRTLLGTSVLPLESDNCMAIRFGRTDDHDRFNPGAYFYFDDIILDPDGFYPLLPP